MTDAEMIARGDTKVFKKRFFCQLDGDGNPNMAGVTEQTFLDIKGNPTTPNVWVPAAVEYKYYNEDDKSVIENKIATKAASLTVAAKEVTK